MDGTEPDATLGRRRYRKKSGQFVIAVQLELETDGFAYQKWGAQQHCKRGDWLVENAGDTYTIDGGEFARTYRRRSPGVYQKVTTIWARVASERGFVPTREGRSEFHEGHYLIADDPRGPDTYCVSKDMFEKMYEPVD